jgi:hypothetical protein
MMREMQAATAHCQHGGDTGQTSNQPSEHDCCKKAAHTCCFKAPSRNGTPTTGVSLDAPRIAATLPAAAPVLRTDCCARVMSHRPATPPTALAPPILRL